MLMEALEFSKRFANILAGNQEKLAIDNELKGWLD